MRIVMRWAIISELLMGHKCNNDSPASRPLRVWSVNTEITHSVASVLDTVLRLIQLNDVVRGEHASNSNSR